MITNIFESYNSHERFDEILGGRIGSVNASRKDATKLITDLNKVYNRGGQHFDFVNNSTSKSFYIEMLFYYNDDRYSLIIYEDVDNKKDKICMSLLVEDKFFKKNTLLTKKGFILNTDNIVEGIDKVLRLRSIKLKDCLSPASYKRMQDDKEDERRRQYNSKDDDFDSRKGNLNSRNNKQKKTKISYLDDADSIEREVPKVAYDHDALHDYSYHRVDMDTYNTAWV